MGKVFTIKKNEKHEDINKEAVKKISSSKKITDFSPGDTIKVGVKIIEEKEKSSIF